VLDAAAVFGVRAIPSAMASIASVRRGAVGHDPQLVVGLVALKILTGGALPAIVDRMVFEPRDLHLAGEAV